MNYYLVLVGVAGYLLQMPHEVLQCMVVCSGKLVDQLLQVTQPLFFITLFDTCHKVIVEVDRDGWVRELFEEFLQQASNSVDVSVLGEVIVTLVHLSRHTLNQVHLTRFSVGEQKM